MEPWQAGLAGRLRESGVSKNSYWIAQMTEGTCQYCGKLTTLIDGHIVPRAFYPSGSIQVLSIDTPSTRRAPKGIYGRQILCKLCDGRFGVYENYATISFAPSPSGGPVSDGGWIYRKGDQHQVVGILGAAS